MIDAAVPNPKKKFIWTYDILLIVVLLAGAYFRLTGSDWGQLNIQHPDENFMTSVTLGIRPVHSLSDYFNTAQSTLNPSVAGYPAYVYGTLPLFIVHYLAESFGKLNAVTLFGRQLSAVADLGTIALLYFIVKRVYKARVALLAAAFSALTVMQIQQSHFYTTDSFSTFFTFLTLAVAALIATGNWKEPGEESKLNTKGASFSIRLRQSSLRLLNDPLTYLSIAFGVTLGMASASKLNAAAVAVVLPIALVVRYFKSQNRKSIQTPDPDRKWMDRTPVEDFIVKAIVFLVIGAVFSLVAFRVFQPYAFSGPGFFGFKLNPEWVQKVREQLLMASPNADLPWDLQWARRNHLYSFQNLTVWGLGLPLGILAWIGFLWMGWRMLKGEWRQHILLWSWTGIYFLWQSMQYNPTMRYQLPIYPLLAMMAAWVVFDWAQPRLSELKRLNWRTFLVATVGIMVLAATAGYAYAFSRIYVRPEPRIAASDWIYQNVPGPINLQVQTGDGTTYQQPLPFSTGAVIQSGLPYQTVFVSQCDGMLNSILLGHVADSSASGDQTLRVILSNAPDPQPQQVLTDLAFTADFTPTGDPRGSPVTLMLDSPLIIQRGITYYLQIQTTGGVMTLIGSAVANETDYDYPLPFRTATYDAFGGIYRGDLNLQVYYPDNPDKFIRFENVLNQTDFILIPTNHQYAQITRIPERYPLTTVYYRSLLGCPEDQDIIWCYRVAEPGMFEGKLGFDLVATFENYPTLGSLVINDQAAEEAFTFYDHPKVLIFKKNSGYDPAKVATLLGAVDLSNVVQLTPGQADNYKDLMLSDNRLVEQQAGGTWSELFDRDAPQNKYPGLGLALWYIVIFFVGLFAFPLVRAALPGLADGGYPLARIAGLLLWAWLVWLAGSNGIAFSKTTIAVALGVVALVGAWQAWRQRDALKKEWGRRWKLYLFIELLFLAFFLLDLLIRLGNPDLWHPSKGGERPMNFAQLNAILKSTTFPPYDPWFAGGYINYYYFGEVIVGTPVKLLGIVPSIAFNFILPTLFAIVATATFSVGYNLIKPRLPDSDRWSLKTDSWRLLTGFSASAVMVLLGNLGVVRLFILGFQRNAAPGGGIEGANLLEKIWWTLKGFFLTLAGLPLPYSPGDWYWFASRIFPYPHDEFYEFPAFTFLWSDLHAHLIAYMLTIFVIAWVISLLVSKAKWASKTDTALGLFLGALVIGSLKPANTWDFYTYFVFGATALFYALARYSKVDHIFPGLPDWVKRISLAAGAVVVLTGLSLLFYQPFSHWFGQAYSSFNKWTGPRTPLSAYLVQWGLLLFFIVSWMAWETREWLAETPVSALKKLRPYRDLIFAALVVVLLALVVQQAWVMLPTQTPPWKGVTILWLAFPLALWAAVLLIFRPGISDLKRLVLFMTGTGLFLTMMVELVVVDGDVGRMNTIYKFGVQSWVLLGISAAASFGWLIFELRKWLPGWRAVWQGLATLLIIGASLFLVVAGVSKMRDRWVSDIPHTLDSMDYMQYARYSEFGRDFSTAEDYRAIVWMQENVQGSPVIVEAAPAGVQYTWLSRFSIYTGLPSVVGWQWHEQQQRVYFSGQVIQRGVDVDNFYNTNDINIAEDILQKYNVRYIIIGQLELGKYTPADPAGSNGLLKFEQFDGIFWNEVYRDGPMVIYEVPIGEGVTP